MYLKLNGYFLDPDTEATIELFNGTFAESDNTIDRNRMADVSLIGNGIRTAVDTTQWSERENKTILRFNTGKAGTWVAGVSTRARVIDMAAADFNNYLEHDGVVDMLAERTANEMLDRDASERYSKHVKTIFQVGNTKTEDWQTVMGYPIEFIPVSNPYDLHTGDKLQVKLLWQGEPLANQLVYIDSEVREHTHEHAHADGERHSHAHTGEHEHAEAAEHTHEHAHADGERHSHAHIGEHEHAGDAEHTHEHAHADGEQHSHAHSGEHEHAEDAEHTHEHAHADGEQHSHAHTSEHEHAGDAEHTHEHAHADGEQHSHAHTGEHEHAGEEASHTHGSRQQMRTDADGLLRFEIAHDGVWYLRTIHLVESGEEGLTHESNWATLTFAVNHDHTHDDLTHVHEHEGGIPSYVYWIGSLLLIGGLFFYFNRNK